jgi:hypothetical protein
MARTWRDQADQADGADGMAPDEEGRQRRGA